MKALSYWRTKLSEETSMFRKIRGIRAFDMADKVGMKEATYTKYERGETKITIDFVQKVAEELKVDLFKILSTSANQFIENVSNSAIYGTYQTTNDHQTQMMMKLMESVMALNERVMKMLEERG